MSSTGVSVLTLMVIVSAVAHAGERANIPGLGMARSSVATARGLDAVGVNPANLAMPDDATVTFSILPFGIRIGSDMLSYDLYTKYFTGVDTDSGMQAKHLSDIDKQDILSRFNNGVGTITADAEARLAGLSFRFEGFGALAFTVSERAGAQVQLPGDYVEFSLYGNPPNSNFDFSQTGGTATWTREYGVTYASAVSVSFIESLTWGVTAKLVHGYGYFELQEFNTSLVTAENGTLTGRVQYRGRKAGIDAISGVDGVGFQPFPEAAGSGYAADLGLAGNISPAVTFGVSVTDIGSLQWTRNIEDRFADTTLVIDDPSDVEDGDAVENALKGATVEGQSFSTPLPTTIRAGVGVKVDEIVEWLPGEMLVGFEYSQGVYDMPGSSPDPRFALGVEYRLLHFLPLRAGVATGGNERFTYALGFGLDFGMFTLDVASENASWLLDPEGFSDGAVAMGMKLRF